MTEFNSEYDTVWPEVAHHVDAYLGYPDVQQSILNEALLDNKREQAAPKILKTVYLAQITDIQTGKRLEPHAVEASEGRSFG